jgi:hypothetical protein
MLNVSSPVFVLSLSFCIALAARLSFNFAHDNLIPSNIHVVWGKWSRRRSGNIFPVQIKVAVVASAPYMAEIASVLHGASEMCANGGKRSQISTRSSN